MGCRVNEEDDPRLSFAGGKIAEKQQCVCLWETEIRGQGVSV